MTRGQFWGMVLFTILVMGGSGGGFVAWFYATSTNRLINAVRNSDTETIKLEIERGANVNAYTALNPANGEGVINFDSLPANVIAITPLMIAAQNGDIETAEMLIDANADVSTTDSIGQNAINYACQMAGNAEILRVLIDNSAEVLSFNAKGESPFNTCIQFDDAEMLRIIFDSIKDRQEFKEYINYGWYGSNFFQQAIKNNNTEIIKMLIEAGFNPSNRDSLTENPEWWAIFDNYVSEEQSYELIKALVKNSPSRLRDRGRKERPLEYAVKVENWAAATATVRLINEYYVSIPIPAWLKEEIRQNAESDIQAEKLLKLIISKTSDSDNNG